MIEKIRKLAPTDIVDYSFLIDCLKEYKKPRDKISDLLAKKALIRIKKGLYILGPDYERGLYTREALANLIYGPSYISLEYALSFYGLIPERVEEVTSMTCGRSKLFTTPLGRFSYHYVPKKHYAVGVTYEARDQTGLGFLIATKEKALADCVARHTDLKSQSAVADYLFGLRIEESELAEMDQKKMEEIALIYQNRQVEFLKEIISEYHGHSQ